MKMKRLVITAVITFFAMNLSACCSNRDDTYQPVCMNNYCGGAYYMGCSSGCCTRCGQSCACTDPDCGGNPCLSCARCCEAFGNDGAS